MPVYVSDLLTATAAPVNAVPTATRAWQWLRGSSAISGATSATYTAVTADIGSPIAASQIETNVAGTATATSAPTEVIQAFDPIRLFSASEPGVWYDPTDMSTLYQNAAGTIPVTSFGQPVGLMLDKSRGGIGPELVVNGTFDTDTSGWTANLSAIVTWVSGQISVQSAANDSRNKAYQAVTCVAGRTYQLRVECTSGTPNIRVNDSASPTAGTVLINTGTAGVIVFAATATTQYIHVGPQGIGTAIFDNISVKELPGNHATQPTTASQPIYGIVPAGGRRNLLTFSEQFDNPIWQKFDVTVPTTQYLAPDGTTTADKLVETTTTTQHQLRNPTTATANTVHTVSLYAKASERFLLRFGLFNGSISSGAFAQFNLNTGAISGQTTAGTATNVSYSISNVGVANGFYRCTVTATVDSSSTSISPFIGLLDSSGNAVYTGNGTSGILIWGAQLEQSATATPYQRVTTQYDVTEAGVASLGYLFFDGSGDFMSTGTITPGTDKAQVFAGVRKLSDATSAVLAEFSANWASNVGAFAFTAPDAGTTAQYGIALRGSGTGGYASISPFPAPITNVVTQFYDIGAATLTTELAARVNGVPITLLNPLGTVGTGDFGNYPLYIGARSGGTLPLNGQLFPLIVRFGPNLTTARISATESWVASKTAGVTL